MVDRSKVNGDTESAIDPTIVKSTSIDVHTFRVRDFYL